MTKTARLAAAALAAAAIIAPASTAIASASGKAPDALLAMRQASRYCASQGDAYAWEDCIKDRFAWRLLHTTNRKRVNALLQNDEHHYSNRLGREVLETRWFARHRFASTLRSLPACGDEDASTGPIPCAWRADKAGNGRGLSFITTGDEKGLLFTYADGHSER